MDLIINDLTKSFRDVKEVIEAISVILGCRLAKYNGRDRKLINRVLGKRRTVEPIVGQLIKEGEAAHNFLREELRRTRLIHKQPKQRNHTLTDRSPS